MQTPSWIKKIFAAISLPFSWIQRFYTKRTLLRSLPEGVQPILAHCDGENLKLDCVLRALNPEEIEATFKYIATYFPHLKSLTLQQNNLNHVPNTIGSLTQLKEANLSHNQLANLPESIGKLSNLRKLDVSNNQLNNLPESIFTLNQLREITLSHNLLNNVSDSIGNLSNLKKLDVSHNQLNNLAESIFTLNQLREITLSHNLLNNLSKSIGNLSNLRKLDVSHNQLNNLPESILTLSQLKEANLSYNQLNKLPESIGNLNQVTNPLPVLRTLQLDHNQFTTLPESIGNLNQLTELDISHNQLTTLPVSIGKLFKLNFANNPSVSLPITFFKSCQKLDFYLKNNKLLSGLWQNSAFYSANEQGFNNFTKHLNQIYQLPEITQVTKFLSLATVSKQFYHLITGKNFTSLEDAYAQNTSHNTTESTLTLSEQNPVANAIPSDASFSMLPNEISKIILLQASGVHPSRNILFSTAFSELILNKPTNKSIEYFLNKTSSNQEEVVKTR